MADCASAALSKTNGGPDPLIGRSINERFKISALIARGGMGKVYRAEQAPLGRVCAVKVLNPNYAGEHDPEFHKRFFLEASIASKLTHPNTVTIFDYGRTDDDVYYMAMEYLEGQTLHRAIRESTFFPEERCAHVARQICRALREAHSLGVIHRDLKPANIFLVQHGDESDFVKVLDFGLVKNVTEGNTDELTQTGLFMGSPKYMAPEQIRGDKVDARTDIYALGVICYEMLTGKVPFDRPNSVNILMAHVNEEVPPIRQMNPNAQLSQETENTVMRCMAKDPDNRFRSMDEVLAALKRVGGSALTATVTGMGTGEYRTLSNSGGHTSASGANQSISGPSAAFMSPSASGGGSIPAGLHGVPSDTGAAMVSAPPRKASKGMLVGAVIGGLALVAVIALAMKPPSPPPATAATGPGASAGAGGPTPTPQSGMDPKVPGSAFVKVRLNSDPDGASVKEDGVEIRSSTPCDMAYRGAEADPTKEHKYVFSKSGFKVEMKAAKIGDSPLTVKLAKAPEAWRPPPQPVKDDKGAMPPGYKVDLPY